MPNMPSIHFDVRNLVKNRNVGEMRGNRVTLRPFRSDELDILLNALRQWLPVEENEPHWRELTSQRIARSGGWGEDGLDFAIEFDGQLAGAVQALGGYYHLPPNVYELGIEFYDESARGHGLGTEVLALFIPRLFEDGAMRLQGHTHIENVPMIRLFDRFGFVREGLLRNYWRLAGRSGNVALYGLLSEDQASVPT